MRDRFSRFENKLRKFIGASPSLAQSEAGAWFDLLAVALFAFQFEGVPSYRRFCIARGITPESLKRWQDIPAVPAAAFKDLEMTSIAPEQRTRVFFSSGTTGQERSRHFHSGASLKLYEASLLPWFERHFLAGAPSKSVSAIALAPPPERAPNSSLVHMFQTVGELFKETVFTGAVSDAGWTLDLDKTQ
jgi:hypothetical protein